jgi:pimeloyl-ACP methyl ester carboxylesterase
MSAPRQRPLTAARLVRLGLAVVIGLALGLSIDIVRSGGPSGWLARRGVVPPYDPLGRLVPVDPAGRTVYLDCRGSGSPTVVFEAGLGNGAAGWGFVFPEAASMTRACAWDRPGLGRSDGRGRHTAGDTVTDLRSALTAAGERGPFIVVAHSLGGVYARVFAAAFTSDVVGLVLIDPYVPDIAPVDVAPVSADYRAAWHEAIASTNALIEDVEDLDWPATEGQLASSCLGGLHVELIFVDQRLRYGNAGDPATVDAVVAAWERLVLDLSTDSRLTIAYRSGHLIHIDRPELVIEAIRRLVDRARSSSADAAARAPTAWRARSAVTPLDRPGPAVVEGFAGGTRQVPQPAGHIRAAVDDRHRDHLAGPPELDPRPARQPAVGNTHDVGRVFVAARRSLTVEARAVEAHLGVPTPRVLQDRAGLGARLNNTGTVGRLRCGGRLHQRFVAVKGSVGFVPRVEGSHRRHRPTNERRDLNGLEEVRVKGEVRVSTGTDHAGDGDQGERDDERRARDDLVGSHVGANRSRMDSRRPMTTRPWALAAT